MEPNNRPRKACDLCYTRKLKCDRQSPRCSNCVTYATDCTHAAERRKWEPKGRRNGRAQETAEIRSLRAQIQSLKAQVVRRAQDQAEDITNSTTAALSQDQPSKDTEKPINSMSLPPLQESLAMIGVFLNTVNTVLPLFHTDTLLRIVGECYALPPLQRDPVVWATINVVLALASQHMPTGNTDGRDRFRTDRATEYLNKAQSIISQLMLGDIRLLNIQALIGMIMVLQTAHDVTPSLILISATMRLAHKLGLHSRAASAHLDPVERRQHAHVFWLAYILDKDLSLRAHQPSIQLDDDIDIELPSPSLAANEVNASACGIVATADGKTKMNFFLARVQLATIEGSIYDYLYSTRAANRTVEQRLMAREGITRTLEQWRASIPLEFEADVVTSNTSNNSAIGSFFCVLHSISLQCITLWLPPGWECLVRQARNFMVLFSKEWSGDAWFRWMASCSYITAMGLLIANDLGNPEHSETRSDSQLVDAALVWLNERISEGQKDDVRVLRDVCVEAVREVRRKRAEAIAMDNNLNHVSVMLPY
ncbi:hypothetical protein GQ53DRAFT_889235 [Thozetella sp. PMI_491]|nr:hypothetical protein GQ53DRAFT_889235 [Thozetella sp. PMI_491]